MNRITKILNITFYSLLLFYMGLWLSKFYNTIPMCYVNEINFIVLWITSFEMGKLVSAKFLQKKEFPFPKRLGFFLVALIIINIPIYLFNAEMQADDAYEFQWKHLLHVPYLINKVSMVIQSLVIIGFVWLSFYFAIQWRNQGRKFIYRLLKISGGLVSVVALFLAINYYQVDDLYLKFDKAPNSFSEFRTHKQFKGKYLYVDFWHSGCGPCIKDFKNYEKFNANLPQEIKDNVEFVYINVDRNTPGESERGKFFINKYNIDANHYFISRAKLHSWWAELDPDATMRAAFSIYFLIDPEGNVIVRNGPKLGDDLKSLLMKETTKNL